MDQAKTETEEKKVTSEGENSEMETVVASTLQQIEDLKAVLMDKAAEIEELHAVTLEQQSKFEEEVASLKTKVEELSKALEDANKAKEEAESELNSMKEDALLQRRMRDLNEHNLLRSSEEAQVIQAEKIKGMTDAEFDVYKEELIDVRNQALGISTVKVVEEEQKEEQPKAEDDLSKATEVIEAVSQVDASDDAKARIRQLIAELQPTSDKTEVEVKESASPEPQRESASCKTLPVDVLSKCFTDMLRLELE